VLLHDASNRSGQDLDDGTVVDRSVSASLVPPARNGRISPTSTGLLHRILNALPVELEARVHLRYDAGGG